MSFKIRTKLIIAFLTVLLPVLVLFVFNTFQLLELRKSVQQSEGIANQISCLSDLSLSIDKMLMPANDYLITGDIRERESFYKHLAEVEDHFPNLSELRICQWGAIDKMLVPEIKEDWLEEMRFLKRVRDGLEKIKGKAEDIFLLKNPTSDASGVRLMIEMDAIAHEVITKDIEDHKKADAKKLTSAILTAEKAQERYFVIRTVGYSIVVALGVFFAIFYSRLFVVQIKKLQHWADAIAGGDFKSRIDIKTGDELEQLANRMNEMAEKLDNFYGTPENQVRERTGELREES